MCKMHNCMKINTGTVVRNCNVLSKDVNVSFEMIVIIYRQQEIAIKNLDISFLVRNIMDPEQQILTDLF